MRIEVLCRAKINESLLVGPRDERGYHPIRTVFQSVNVCDRLSLETSSENSFSCSTPLPEHNTVTRAWNLVRELVSLPPLRVQLEKEIPVLSGLGGGSADAAGFLRAVHQLTGRILTREQIMEIALAVGADVPFLIEGGRAIGEGYGELLTPLPDLVSRAVLLAKPLIGCPTAEMYAKLDSISRPHDLFAREGNDFERVAPRECLALIAQMKQLGSEQAALSGSGSAVYGYFESEESARVAYQQIETEWKTVARTEARMPL